MNIDACIVKMVHSPVMCVIKNSVARIMCRHTSLHVVGSTHNSGVMKHSRPERYKLGLTLKCSQLTFIQDFNNFNNVARSYWQIT